MVVSCLPLTGRNLPVVGWWRFVAISNDAATVEGRQLTIAARIAGSVVNRFAT